MRKKNQHRTKPSRLRQLFTSSKEKDAEPREADHDEHADHAQEVEREAMPIEPSRPEDRAPISDYSGDKSQSKPQPTERPRWTDSVQAVSTVVIAIFSIVTFFIVRYQLDAMRQQAALMDGQLKVMQDQSNSSSGQMNIMQDQSESMKEQADAMRDSLAETRNIVKQNERGVTATERQAQASLTQAGVAKQSLGAAQTSARAAERSATIAAQSLSIGERPYVEDGAITMTQLAAGKPIIATVEIGNTGKTPALNLRTQTGIALIRTPAMINAPVLPALPNWDKAERMSRIFLGANARVEQVATSRDSATVEWVNEIQAGKIIIYVYGRAIFTDGLNSPHSMEFCRWYDPNTKGFN